VAFGVRTLPTKDLVFQNDKVNFISVDSYYYMRLADNVYENFPNFEPDKLRQVEDVYSYELVSRGIVPTTKIDITYAYIIAITAKVFNTSTDLAGVWLPPIFTLFTILCAYFIARKVFNKWIAIMGAGILSVIPGEFLSRTSLGEPDHHWIEIFTSSLAILAFVYTLKSTKWKYLLSIITGFSLAFYLMNWDGGLILILIIDLFVFVMWLIQNIKQELNSHIYIITSIMIGVTGILLAIGGYSLMHIGFCFVSALSILVMWQNFRLGYKNGIFRVLGLGALIIIVFYVIAPKYFLDLFQYVSFLFVWHTWSATAEEAPLFIINNQFTINVAWNYFNTCLIFFLVGLGVLFYQIKEKLNQSYIFVACWGICFLLWTMAMKRFAYYLVIPISILSGYCIWTIIQLLAVSKVKIKNGFKKAVSPGTSFLIIILVLIVSIVPSIRADFDPNNGIRNALITQGWSESLDWLNQNTPNSTDYGVLSWWDYGYWIQREGKRVTYNDPGGGERNVVGWIFSFSEIDKVMQKLTDYKVKYIIIDYQMATMKEYAIAEHGGYSRTEYVNQYPVGQNKYIITYSPQYFDTLLARLYFFDNKTTESVDSTVIRIKDGVAVENKQMPYKQALEFVKTNRDCIIVTMNPFQPPFKVESLSQIKLVYSSPTLVNIGNQSISEVKIFEVIK
jgi:asparagine N-glycosylation enzyme membrane subunit Stt3